MLGTNSKKLGSVEQRLVDAANLALGHFEEVSDFIPGDYAGRTNEVLHKLRFAVLNAGATPYKVDEPTRD